MRLKVKEDFSRIKVQMNVQKSLRRGIFVSTGATEKTQLPFKYENLVMFYYLISSVLKAKLSIIWKVSAKLQYTARRSMKQCFYVGNVATSAGMNNKIDGDDTISRTTMYGNQEKEGRVNMVKVDLKSTMLGHKFKDRNGDKIPSIKDDNDWEKIDHDG